MDELTQEIQAAQQASSMAALFALVLIVMVVLVGVVLIQNRKIKEMQKPKYGFLGKPLNAFIVLAIMLGGIGLTYYTTLNRTNQFEDVSADSSVDATIVITQLDSVNQTYQFNTIPTIDFSDWGGSSTYTFDVYWTISNGDVYSQIELGLSSQNQGGIQLSLKKGTYTVKSTIYVGDRMIEKETTLEVE